MVKISIVWRENREQALTAFIGHLWRDGRCILGGENIQILGTLKRQARGANRPFAARESNCMSESW